MNNNHVLTTPSPAPLGSNSARSTADIVSEVINFLNIDIASYRQLQFELGCEFAERLGSPRKYLSDYWLTNKELGYWYWFRYMWVRRDANILHIMKAERWKYASYALYFSERIKRDHEGLAASFLTYCNSKAASL